MRQNLHNFLDNRDNIWSCITMNHWWKCFFFLRFLCTVPSWQEYFTLTILLRFRTSWLTVISCIILIWVGFLLYYWVLEIIIFVDCDYREDIFLSLVSLLFSNATVKTKNIYSSMIRRRQHFDLKLGRYCDDWPSWSVSNYIICFMIEQYLVLNCYVNCRTNLIKLLFIYSLWTLDIVRLYSGRSRILFDKKIPRSKLAKSSLECL